MAGEFSTRSRIDAMRLKSPRVCLHLTEPGSLSGARNVLSLWAGVKNRLRRGWSLVIAGMGDDDVQPLEDTCASLAVGKDTQIMPCLTALDVAALLRFAEVMVSPDIGPATRSTLMMAMTRGTALLACDGESLDELLGESALRFDPQDNVSGSRALTRLLTEPILRRHLIGSGIERSRDTFSSDTNSGQAMVSLSPRSLSMTQN